MYFPSLALLLVFTSVAKLGLGSWVEIKVVSFESASLLLKNQSAVPYAGLNNTNISLVYYYLLFYY
jgi:hypothetical protein